MAKIEEMKKWRNLSFNVADLVGEEGLDAGALGEALQPPQLVQLQSQLIRRHLWSALGASSPSRGLWVIVGRRGGGGCVILPAFEEGLYMHKWKEIEGSRAVDRGGTILRKTKERFCTGEMGRMRGRRFTVMGQDLLFLYGPTL